MGEEKRGGGDLILIEYQRGSGEGEDGTNALYGACELLMISSVAEITVLITYQVVLLCVTVTFG